MEFPAWSWIVPVQVVIVLLPVRGTKYVAPGATQEIVAVKPAAVTDPSDVNRIVNGPLVEVIVGRAGEPLVGP